MLRTSYGIRHDIKIHIIIRYCKAGQNISVFHTAYAMKREGETMVTATWKIDGIFKADPQKVADEIDALGGEVTPEQLVEAAKDKKSELHKCFDWDNRVAAEKWRKHQARQIMCFLVIRNEDEDGNQQAPVVRYMYKTDTGGYKPSKMIFKQDDEYQKLLQRVDGELHAIKQKYAYIQERDYIWELID